MNNAIDKALGTPNSIDIHSINNISSLKKYFSKYMTKHNQERRSVCGKIWGTSELVSQYKGITIELNGLKSLEFLDYYKTFHDYVFCSDFFNIYKCCITDIDREFPKSLIAAEFRKKMLEKYNIKVKSREEYMKN